MTEASPTVTHMVKGSGKYESVGGPIPNTEMKVVHPENRSNLAARQTGEICTRGPQVRERERERAFRIRYFLYLVLSSLFYMTAVVATSCRLTHRINIFHSADHPYGRRNIGVKLLVEVVV
jgi:hypothetical protein